MNTFNEIGKQIAELFNSMTPSARVMAGLMVTVIIVSLGWIFGSQTASTKEYLFGGREFSDAELEQWEATFGDAQLRDWERVGRRIKVPTAEKDLYLKSLSGANALPKEWGGYLDSAMNSGNPFDPNSLVQKRFEVARERELAAQIRRMPQIDWAAVEFDEHRQGFGRKSERTCSISVQGRANMPIPQDTMRQISLLASTFFAGLPKENITVLDLGTSTSYRSSSDPNSPEENPYLQAQSQWEEMYTEKVLRTLSNFGEVQVTVNVELDPTLTEASEKLQYDPTTVAVQSSTSRKDLENAKGTPSGPLGAGSNGLSNTAQSLSSTAPAQSSKTKESEENERRIAGHEAIITKTAGLVPRKVSVSIGVPDSYYRDIWAFRFLRDNPDKATEDVPPLVGPDLNTLQTEVKSSVVSAVKGIPVGIRDGDDREPFIEVYSYTDLPIPEIPGPTLAENSLAWFSDSWSTLALLAVVLVSLGMMASFVRSQGEPDTDKRFAEGFGLEVPDNIADELDLSSGGDAGSTSELDADGKPKRTFEVTGGEVKDDLSSLVKENPEAAVNLLKTWIGDAA